MKVKVSLFGLTDMLRFKNLAKNRLEAIENTKAEKLPDYPINDLAKYYHPYKQHLLIKDIREENETSKTFVLVPDAAEGTSKLAPFKAGSYISLYVDVHGEFISRAYAVSSSPEDAEKGIYEITVKRKEGGIVSGYLLDEAKIGDKLFSTEPGGFLTYDGLRDAKDVVAVAGGTGITPFVSMAKAISEGSEDFSLTILYGVKKESDIIYRAFLDGLKGKVKVVYVLEEGELPGAEKGLIGADLIRKYAPKGKAYSVFASGPNGLLDHMEKEVAKLGLPKKYFRLERSPFTLEGDKNVYKMKVHVEGEVVEATARGDETVLAALERAHVVIRAKCHLGSCGYCRSRLLSGEIKTTKLSKVTNVDKDLHYFHPCCSYPVSDIEVEVYPY